MLHACAGRWTPQRRMDDRPDKRLTGRELDALFDRLFRTDSAAQTCLRSLRRERSPLLACFHLSVNTCSRTGWRFTATWKSGVVSHDAARARRRSNRRPEPTL
jgi:hypothetical protein